MRSGHPWIFRSKLSSAVEAFSEGQWLKLVDSQNKILGYGIFQKEGLIGIRILKRGEQTPDTKWIRETLSKILQKRKNLRVYTDSYRAVHGENDGIAGVVVDLYGGKNLVLQTYSQPVDVLGRYISWVLRKELKAKSVLWKLPTRRKSTTSKAKLRVLYGKNPGSVSVREGKLNYSVELGEGQKSGAFLDLRGLRKWVSMQGLNNRRVLNLFSYTGTLGLAAEIAGASEIWNVDVSQGALQFGKMHHSKKKQNFRWIKEDIFKWLSELSPKKTFDLIIVDPPSMVSQSSQVSGALNKYRKIYQDVFPHLSKKGILICCCCTSRISYKQFKDVLEKTFQGRLKKGQRLLPEDDHPIGFPEGEYLKILIYAKK